MFSVLAIDYGEKRVGLALASLEARLAHPYKTLPNDERLYKQLEEIVEKEAVAQFVVGLPRSLEGNDTPQTVLTREFAQELERHFELPITLQDEAGTSVKAREELDAKRKPYRKEDIDSLAATYILEDYLINMEKG